MPSSSETYSASKPISLHPRYPRIFLFRGKPTVLITSGEHYGAVLNLDFDYATYLETLAADRLNMTRTFSGTYLEQAGNFNIAENTLAPLPDRFSCPWKRSNTPAAADGGNKFDLSQWDGAYFQRLKEFMREAGRRGVVVEYTLFCPMYEDSMWNLCPMNGRNNVNGVGDIPRTEPLTLKHPSLLAFQLAFVRKVVAELREFDNLIYEICNEPYFGGVTLEWQRKIAETIADAESGFRDKHLISQNIANNTAKVTDPIPQISVFQFHYARPPVAVADNWHLNKAIGCNETGFDGNSDFVYRSQGWDFMMAGGAVYNNLDYSFTASHPNGTFPFPPKQPGGGSPNLRRQLRILRDFLESFELVRMKPSDSVIVGGLSQGVTAHCLADSGREYGVYVKGGTQVDLVLEIPHGRWQAEWLNPRTGEVDKSTVYTHTGGRLTVASCVYSEDIALALRQTR